MPPIEIELLPPAASDRAELMARISGLTNEVYAEAERGLWTEGATRETGEFGMLAADPAHRGIGVGRELVRFAERASRDAGLQTMQLELLVPKGWTHPAKAFLDAWYTRLGYRVVHTGRLDDDYPTLAPLPATPCDLMTYERALDP